jgi:hypothetical protein
MPKTGLLAYGENIMRTRILLALPLGLLLAPSAYAQNGNLDRATNTVNNIRQADPPTVSTGTVVTPQAPPPQQMPNGGSDVHRNPPPSPSR